MFNSTHNALRVVAIRGSRQLNIALGDLARQGAIALQKRPIFINSAKAARQKIGASAHQL